MQNKTFKSLFISYDGLTDPLGQSQILPYIIGLAHAGFKMTILSCEKKDRFKEKEELIQSICKANNIEWVPLLFHKSPPILAKYYDLFNLKKTARKLYLENRYNIIHCRSYLSAEIGRELKKKYGARYLFDMRGFWVDERVDGGLWNTKYAFYRFAYKKYKHKEALLIADADHIISLTEAGKKEIRTWQSYKNSTPITVIPCSADLNLFTLTDDAQQLKAKDELRVKKTTFVLSYLGSLGTWYLLEEMLLLFKAINDHYKVAKFLILTPDDPDIVYKKAATLGLGKKDFIIRFVERRNVPFLIKASDLSVSFIKPAYSKIASSPTKLGELLAMGIPVICNSIGDVEMIIDKSGGGAIMNEFKEVNFKQVIKSFPALLSKDKTLIRKNIQDYYSLSNAIDIYDKVYRQLLNVNN